MDAFTDCTPKNQPTAVLGELGKRDVELNEVIFEAARNSKKVSTKDVFQVMGK